MTNKYLFRQSIYIAILLVLSGCASVAVTGITSFGYSLAQEKSMGDAIDDVTIGTHINAFYLRENAGKLFKQVAVEVQEGRVLLTGNVDNPTDRVEAVRLAWQPKGVKEVINEIQINNKPSLKSYAQDIWITTQVRSKLFIEGAVKSINYSIDTVNGVVYVMGIAANQAESAKVNDIISRIKGVKKVVSHARLKS